MNYYPTREEAEAAAPVVTICGEKMKPIITLGRAGFHFYRYSLTSGSVYIEMHLLDECNGLDNCYATVRYGSETRMSPVELFDACDVRQWAEDTLLAMLDDETAMKNRIAFWRVRNGKQHATHD